ncbi:hypothetical protein QBC41DRAFT_300102 [Cercophora samala]|uniref:Uncharacterized protein n=1 Tax=Cercophora samala TaxID=330535 RepID=A0AA40DF30_9PEZI|nr:hypothetical protein QBC41DRAFT_300102 [Cercophora samala]
MTGSGGDGFGGPPPSRSPSPNIPISDLLSSDEESGDESDDDTNQANRKRNQKVVNRAKIAQKAAPRASTLQGPQNKIQKRRKTSRKHAYFCDKGCVVRDPDTGELMPMPFSRGSNRNRHDTNFHSRPHRTTAQLRAEQKAKREEHLRSRSGPTVPSRESNLSSQPHRRHSAPSTVLGCPFRALQPSTPMPGGQLVQSTPARGQVRQPRQPGTQGYNIDEEVLRGLTVHQSRHPHQPLQPAQPHQSRPSRQFEARQPRQPRQHRQPGDDENIMNGEMIGQPITHRAYQPQQLGLEGNIIGQNMVDHQVPRWAHQPHHRPRQSGNRRYTIDQGALSHGAGYQPHLGRQPGNEGEGVFGNPIVYRARQFRQPGDEGYVLGDEYNGQPLSQQLDQPVRRLALQGVGAAMVWDQVHPHGHGGNQGNALGSGMIGGTGTLHQLQPRRHRQQLAMRLQQDLQASLGYHNEEAENSGFQAMNRGQAQNPRAQSLHQAQHFEQPQFLDGLAINPNLLDHAPVTGQSQDPIWAQQPLQLHMSNNAQAPGFIGLPNLTDQDQNQIWAQQGFELPMSNHSQVYVPGLNGIPGMINGFQFQGLDGLRHHPSQGDHQPAQAPQLGQQTTTAPRRPSSDTSGYSQSLGQEGNQSSGHPGIEQSQGADGGYLDGLANWPNHQLPPGQLQRQQYQQEPAQQEQNQQAQSQQAQSQQAQNHQQYNYQAVNDVQEHNYQQTQPQANQQQSQQVHDDAQGNQNLGGLGQSLDYEQIAQVQQEQNQQTVNDVQGYDEAVDLGDFFNQDWINFGSQS